MLGFSEEVKKLTSHTFHRVSGRSDVSAELIACHNENMFETFISSALLIISQRCLFLITRHIFKQLQQLTQMLACRDLMLPHLVQLKLYNKTIFPPAFLGVTTYSPSDVKTHDQDQHTTRVWVSHLQGSTHTGWETECVCVGGSYFQFNCFTTCRPWSFCSLPCLISAPLWQNDWPQSDLIKQSPPTISLAINMKSTFFTTGSGESCKTSIKSRRRIEFQLLGENAIHFALQECSTDASTQRDNVQYTMWNQEK